ncbi:hypothetical protein FACS1894105_12750 [Clostridia bacterium]|nr:hypothetical protein FACS1894105_12750 [Clostridia bacterium]
MRHHKFIAGFVLLITALSHLAILFANSIKKRNFNVLLLAAAIAEIAAAGVLLSSCHRDRSRARKLREMDTFFDYENLAEDYFGEDFDDDFTDTKEDE